MRRVAKLGRANIPFRRVYHRPRTERSSVDWIERSRECCKRKRSGKRLSPSEDRLWASRRG